MQIPTGDTKMAEKGSSEGMARGLLEKLAGLTVRIYPPQPPGACTTRTEQFLENRGRL